MTHLFASAYESTQAERILVISKRHVIAWVITCWHRYHSRPDDYKAIPWALTDLLDDVGDASPGASGITIMFLEVTSVSVMG